MSAIVHARVLENLARLRLGHVVERLDALLAEAARGEPTYLDFLDSLLRGEVDSKQRKRVAMGHDHRSFSLGEDARRFRLQVAALDRSATRSRARHRPLHLPGGECAALRTARGRQDPPRHRPRTRRRRGGSFGAFHQRLRAARRALPRRARWPARRQARFLRQAQAPYPRRARLSALREAIGASLLPARRSPLRKLGHPRRTTTAIPGGCLSEPDSSTNVRLQSKHRGDSTFVSESQHEMRPRLVQRLRIAVATLRSAPSSSRRCCDSSGFPVIIAASIVTTDVWSSLPSETLNDGPSGRLEKTVRTSADRRRNSHCPDSSSPAWIHCSLITPPGSDRTVVRTVLRGSHPTT